MSGLFSEEFQQEMDEWFEYMDSIVYSEEPISDEEAEYLESQAELHYGV